MMTSASPQTHKLLPFLTGLFVATILISNTIEIKTLDVMGLTISAGMILFPLFYVLGDVLTEVYGYAVTRRTIWIGLLCQLVMSMIYELARIMPAPPFWQHQECFDSIFTQTLRFVLATLVASFCGQFVNAYIMARLKIAHQGRNPAARLLLSSMGGQAVDAILLVTLAFAGSVRAEVFVKILFLGWFSKVLWEVFALPLTLHIISFVKKFENQDVYDVGTDFNPFRLSDSDNKQQAAS